MHFRSIERTLQFAQSRETTVVSRQDKENGAKDVEGKRTSSVRECKSHRNFLKFSMHFEDLALPREFSRLFGSRQAGLGIIT